MKTRNTSVLLATVLIGGTLLVYSAIRSSLSGCIISIIMLIKGIKLSFSQKDPRQQDEESISSVNRKIWGKGYLIVPYIGDALVVCSLISALVFRQKNAVFTVFLFLSGALYDCVIAYFYWDYNRNRQDKSK